MLPNPVRYATLATLTLAAMVSFASVSNLQLTFEVENIDLAAGETPMLTKLTPNPEAYAKAQRAQGAAFRNTIEAMRWPRVVVLFLLSSASAMVLIATIRLRWPGGMPRLAVLQLLSRASLGSAVLRVLDGAQQLVIVQASADAYERTLTEQHVDVPSSLNFLFSAGSVVMTVVVTGLFVAASSYFRSERLQQTIALVDRNSQNAE